VGPIGTTLDDVASFGFGDGGFDGDESGVGVGSADDDVAPNATVQRTLTTAEFSQRCVFGSDDDASDGNDEQQRGGNVADDDYQGTVASGDGDGGDARRRHVSLTPTCPVPALPMPVPTEAAMVTPTRGRTQTPEQLTQMVVQHVAMRKPCAVLPGVEAHDVTDPDRIESLSKIAVDVTRRVSCAHMWVRDAKTLACTLSGKAPVPYNKAVDRCNAQYRVARTASFMTATGIIDLSKTPTGKPIYRPITSIVNCTSDRLAALATLIDSDLRQPEGAVLCTNTFGETSVAADIVALLCRWNVDHA